MSSLECSFPLIGKVNIEIKNHDLYLFAKRELQEYVLRESSQQKSDSFVSIFAQEMLDIEVADIQLSRDIEFKDAKLKIVKNSRVKELKFEYNFKNSLSISIEMKKKSLYYLKALKNSNYSMLHSLFYETLLYPIFSLYALKDNYSLVHGSLLKIAQSYILLTGLDGVGKSSLSTQLMANDAKIVADNFVLYNGENFIGLNMPIRLDLESEVDENIVYKDSNLKEVLYSYKESKALYIESLYFLVIGEKLQLKEIDATLLKQNYMLINSGASEILGANLFNVPFIYINNFSKKIESQEFKSFMFEIPKGKIKEATKELMCHLNT